MAQVVNGRYTARMDESFVVFIPFRFVDGIMKAWQRYSTHG
jgi:hypothetical protein